MSPLAKALDDLSRLRALTDDESQKLERSIRISHRKRKAK